MFYFLSFEFWFLHQQIVAQINHIGSFRLQLISMIKETLEQQTSKCVLENILL